MSSIKQNCMFFTHRVMAHDRDWDRDKNGDGHNRKQWFLVLVPVLVPM